MISQSSRPSIGHSPWFGHAVVIGAGMASLLAAGVLANYFERVTLVDRDSLSDDIQVRKGVPQGRILHALLPRGQGIIERILPGYGSDLRTAGAVSLRFPADALVLGPAGWLDRRAPGFPLLSASRPLIEWAVRRRVRELSGVTILDRHDVTSLATSEDGLRITGVHIRGLADANSRQRLLDADLVVDASGRQSRTADWLSAVDEHGFRVTRVDSRVSYASRIYRIPDRFSADWKLAMIFSQPPSMARGYLYPIEDGQWIVALMGTTGQHPPTDEDGFAAFAHTLRHPVIADALSVAEPVTQIRGYRGTANRMWHYERAQGWPDRFVVLGDAVCAFNPIYGQGMSSAAIAAETLDACLRGLPNRRTAPDLGHGWAHRFQRRLARSNAGIWMMATREDLRYPSTTGARLTTAVRMQHRYLDRVGLAATRNPVIADAYARVFGLLEPPRSLMAPRVLVAAGRARPQNEAVLPPPAAPSTRMISIASGLLE